VRQANPALRSPVWNDAKVTAHHAIIPTGQTPALLSERQHRIYDLIVRAYLAQFFPPYRYREIRIQLDVVGEIFKATGQTPLAPGWKVVYGREAEDGEPDDKSRQILPMLKVGDTGRCEHAEVLAKKTTPPLYFTEGTLIAAMTRIHQLVEDPDLKKRLKETAGMGTEATRAGIIETLKKRRFIVEHGKTLRDTPAGRHLIQALPEPVKSPGLTGLFEQLLKGIEEGTVAPERFLSQQIGFVEKYVQHAREAELTIAPLTPKTGRTKSEPQGCPACGQGQLRRIKGKTGYFWGCSRFRDGCQAIFPDRAGAPASTGTTRRSSRRGRR
jgi:DNA topoisomerase-3